MAAVVEIRCPNCGRVDPVRKVGVGRYRCEECGHEFTHEDVLDAVADLGPDERT